LVATDADTFAQINKEYPNSVLNTSGGKYLYIDNGSNILAVAHVDTVESSPKSYYSPVDKTWTKFATTPYPLVKKTKITSIKLDDRLGLHIILDILPTMGINVDVLLTDDEEWAQSTAGIFTTEKVYNWAFSFDRRGVGEVVMYQYDDCKEAVERVIESGWYHGQGTYSDIADLNLNCACFNFSAGYMHEHTDACYCQYNSVMYIAQLFKKFYNSNKDTRFAFTKQAKVYSWADDKYYKDNYKGNKYVSIVDKSTTSGSTLYKDNKYKHTSAEYSGLGTCNSCGTQSAHTWDMHGSPICDDCAWDMYQEPAKDCEYCGMPIHNADDLDSKGDVEDDIYDGICVSCAEWLRANMNDEDLCTMNMKLKGEKI